MPTFAAKTLSRFLLVGIGNTVLGLGVIFAAMNFTSPFLANLVGYLIVAPISFLGHRRLSFQHTGAKLPALAKYLFVFAVGYASNLATLNASTNLFGNLYIAQTMAIGMHVIITYLLSNYYVFPKSECRRA
jgi:putative flippase GtrA